MKSRLHGLLRDYIRGPAAVYNRKRLHIKEVSVSKKVIFILIIVAAIAAFSTPNFSAASSAQVQFPTQRSERTEMQREIEDRQRKEENKKRQEEIKTDTQKLFQLATELKDAVDKSNEHLLSLNVIKKAEEVEKLAKKVKEKMKEGSGKPVIGEPPPVPVPSLQRPPR